jgi:hypothetical protein
LPASSSRSRQPRNASRALAIATTTKSANTVYRS